MSLNSPQTQEEHRLLNLCMLFMEGHPRAGAELLAVHLNETNPYRLGWNYVPGVPGVMADRWLYLEQDRGHWTRTTPPEGTEIHRVSRPDVPLSDTTAWRWAVQLGLNPLMPPEFRDILAKIEKASGEISFTHDVQKETEAGIAALRRLRATAERAETVSDIAEPIVGIVRSHLRLDQPGVLSARELVSVLFDFGVFLCGTDYAANVNVQLISRNLLAERVAELLDERNGMRVGCFDKMTYLAALYAATALRLSDLIRSELQPNTEQRKRLEGMDQYLDEKLCHEASPYFVYFSMPPFQRFLLLQKFGLTGMADRYGNKDGPYIDLEDAVANKYTPFDLGVLEQVFEELQRIRGV
jgi:hypothetical protein